MKSKFNLIDETREFDQESFWIPFLKSSQDQQTHIQYISLSELKFQIS